MINVYIQEEQDQVKKMINVYIQEEWDQVRKAEDPEEAPEEVYDHRSGCRVIHKHSIEIRIELVQSP